MSDKEEKKVIKKSKPVCPTCYDDGVVSMHSSMITTESNFLRIWGLHHKGKDMKVAYKAARKWRDKFKD